MPDTVFDFDAMRALGTTLALTTHGADWVFLNALYPAVPVLNGPSTPF